MSCKPNFKAEEQNMIPPQPLILVSTSTPATYRFETTGDGFRSWALCTVNDTTGELCITSDWGNWSYRWSADPGHLGFPTLAAFIGTRGGVDYLARKLQREGRDGHRWSAEKTVVTLRRRLCTRRLEEGRTQLENRLEPDDMPDGKLLQHLIEPVGNYTADGLPIYSGRMPAEYRNGRPWKLNGEPYEPLPFLTPDAARRLWDEIGELTAFAGSSDLFYVNAWEIEGFSEYVTDNISEYVETEQTPEDKALRDLVLPALIEACRARITAGSTPATAASTARDDRQAQIFAWPQAAFTVEQATSLPQRGLRLLEESIEAFQAVGGDPAQAHKLVDYVFSRPVGVLHQGLGGVNSGLLALSAAAGLSAEAEEQREVTRVLAKPIEEFTRRNEAKNAAGFLAQEPRPTCANMSPPWFAGRWLDWHRGHGCDKDDGKPRTPEGEAEIAAGGSR
jgi:hypothetical protein